MSARPARRIAQISAPTAAEAPTLPPRDGRDNGPAGTEFGRAPASVSPPRLPHPPCRVA